MEDQGNPITWKNCLRVGAAAFLLFLCIYYWSAAAGLDADAMMDIKLTLRPEKERAAVSRVQAVSGLSPISRLWD